MDLKDKVKHAPMEPGCYLFKDESGRIIYIGKAKVIRNRVKQYFMKTNQQDDKGLMLAKLIRDVEFQVTATERDALFLEYQLIKEHRPWFNSQHKRDRLLHYYLVLNRTGRYPSIELFTQPPDRAGDILGRFKSEGRAREAIAIFGKVYRTPICGRRFDAVSDPCLHYQVGRCLGPCTGEPAPEEYAAVLKDIAGLMQGKTSVMLNQLKKDMTFHVKNLEFEEAAVLKQTIEEVEGLRIRSGKISIPVDRDVVLAIRAYREDGFSLFYFHQGNIAGRCESDGRISDKMLGCLLSQTAEETEGEGNVPAKPPVTRSCLEEVSADRKLILLSKDKNLEKRIQQIKKNVEQWLL